MTRVKSPLVIHGSDIAVAGIPFRATTMSNAVDDLVDAARAGSTGGVTVRLANAYSVAFAARDADYSSLLRGPGVNLPDGSPVAMVMRWKARRRGCSAEQIRGPSFFPNVIDQGRAVGLRHFLLGGTEANLLTLAQSIERKFPGAEIAGSWAPPFGPFGAESLDEATVRIRVTAPHVVWVSLGTPKQDFAARSIAAATELPVVAVGAAFDFLSGVVGEAPTFMQRHGLEWLHRFSREPGRLWRRYLFGNIRFIGAVAKAEIVPHLSRARD